MEIVERNVVDLTPYAKNPRQNEEAAEKVADSIREFGFLVPIVVDKDGVVVAGHTRLKAAQLLGMEKVPTITAEDLTPEQIQAYRLADNKTQELATWNELTLALELFEIKDIDMQEFGFEKAAIVEPEEPQEEPEGDIVILRLELTEEQKEAIDKACEAVKNDVYETFGNTNKVGNRLYEVIRQWAEMRDEG